MYSNTSNIYFLFFQIDSDDPKLRYITPVLKESDYYFYETFDSLDSFSNTWVKSKAKKEGAEEEIAKYDGNSWAYFLILSVRKNKVRICTI